MEKVNLYTMKNCTFCERAKALLKQRGIVYDEIFVHESDEAAWDKLFKRSGLRTMPQIFVGDRLIGGFSDLSDLDSKDQLASLK